MTRHRNVAGWTVGAVLTALSASYVWGFVLADGRQSIDLRQWVDPQSAVYDREMMPNPRWATRELCGGPLPCIQAVTSDTLTMVRFVDRDDAEAYAEALGEDGYLTGWIVVRYEPDGLTAQQRTGFETVISCINTWVGEEGQDC